MRSIFLAAVAFLCLGGLVGCHCRESAEVVTQSDETCVQASSLDSGRPHLRQHPKHRHLFRRNR